MATKQSVVGFVKTRAEAERVILQLISSGFSKSDISVVSPDMGAARDVVHEKSTKVPEGAAAGAGAGGVLGGTFGVLVGIGALAIPGVGPLIAAGPLLAALSGAAVGAAVGGVSGALVGLGIPEVEAKIYEGHLRSGNVLIAVHVNSDDQRKRAMELLKQADVDEIAAVNEAPIPKSESMPSKTTYR